MRKKLFICSALVSVALLSAPHAYSEDDVIVDLSVLGNLQNVSTSIPTAQVKTQPLFPTVQQKASQPKVKTTQKKAKKKAVVDKKKKVEKKEQSVSTQSKKEEVTAEKEVKFAPDTVLPVNTVEQEKNTAANTAITSNIPSKSKADCQQEDVNERIMAQPMSNECQNQAKEAEAKAQQQNKPSATNMNKKQEADKVAPEVVVVKVRENSKKTTEQPTIPTTKAIEKKATVDMLAPVNLNKNAETLPSPKKIMDSKEVEKKVQVEDVSQNINKAPENSVQVLSPQQQEKQTEPEVKTVKAGNDLVFVEGESDLTPSQEKQLDSILSNFKDAKNSKIAIVAYNLDDGKDAFLRKRNSLNRAVNIRSYLLGKGYKNYSIKVINVEEGDPRINTVNVSERKK